APEIEKAVLRAQTLCQRLGETPQLIHLLLWVCTVRFTRAEHHTARELAEQCLSLAQRVSSATYLVHAHKTLGDILYALVDFALAPDHHKQGIVLYDPQQYDFFVFGQTQEHFTMSCLSYAAWALWHLGYPDQALKMSQEALALVARAHPF